MGKIEFGTKGRRYFWSFGVMIKINKSNKSLAIGSMTK
jgi:hypothetical protein